MAPKTPEQARRLVLRKRLTAMAQTARQIQLQQRDDKCWPQELEWKRMAGRLERLIKDFCGQR